jgi:alpha-glucosidase
MARCNFRLVRLWCLSLMLFAVCCAQPLCSAGPEIVVSVDSQNYLTVASATNGTLLNVSLLQFLQVVEIQWVIQSGDGNVKVRKTFTPLTQPNQTKLTATNSSDGSTCNISLSLGSGFSGSLVIGSHAAVGQPSGVASYALYVTAPPSYTSSNNFPTATATSVGLIVTQFIDAATPLFGGGEQYNTVDLRGRINVVFSREQGVGRGLQPITSILDLVENSGGSDQTNYAARPVLASRAGWLFIQENPSYSEMDTTIDGVLSYFINDTFINGWLGRSPDGPAGAVAAISSLVGRPPPLPSWSYSGAIVGMQGGTAAVLANFSALEQLGCPMAAFWLQDWTGVRPLDIRQGLWWHWRWNSTHYPNYDGMIETLAAAGIRTMTYLNPMLVLDPAAPTMYEVALTNGYFVRCGKDDLPWVGYNGASLIDFTNPNATAWYQAIIEEVIASGVSGWMADFGESVPLDANLFDTSVPAHRYHSEYPDKWFAVNRAAATAANKSDEVFFFGRSAWLRSASLYSAGWSGDQLCNFDNFDGIGSAVTSLVTSGLSGTLFQHSDIGGYNTILWYHRTEELFLRWCELSSFSTIFRSHDGSDPQANWQFYRTPDTMARFARYARLFNVWHFYRADLVAEAISNGLPVVRPVFLHYPEEDAAYNLTLQYLVGSELLVAPVTIEGAETVAVTIPRGSCWTHIWSNTSVTAPSTAPLVIPQAAPLGCPAVFIRCNSYISQPFFSSLATGGVMSECSK